MNQGIISVMNKALERLKKATEQISPRDYSLFFVALLLWCVTFYTDTFLFTKDALNMNSLPVDLDAVNYMHVGSKLIQLAVLFLMLKFVVVAFQKPTLFFSFLFLLVIYGIGVYLTYPGYFMSDDPIIFAYATRYYPVYWHSYLTSLYYCVALSCIPASSGVILFHSIISAMVFAWISDQCTILLPKKATFLTLLLGLLPFVLLGGLMCFRPVLYAPIFAFFVATLFFESVHKPTFTIRKMVLFAFLCSLLALWRSEAILLIVFVPILIWMIYNKQTQGFRKKWLIFLVCMLSFFMLLKLPQSAGEKKYYGSDYLIISTTRPLSVILHRDQTYPGADKDLEAINKVTKLDYITNDSLSCSAYNRYNSDHNEGKFTQTGADKAVQSAYLKAAFRLIYHNLDLYFAERLQLFLITNGFFDYNSSMVLDLKPVVATNFHLYQSDRDYGFELIDAYRRIPVYGETDYANFLFKFGGEAYLLVMAFGFVLFLYSLIRKDWFLSIMLVSIFTREGIIFLSAPVSFIQYSYPSMYGILVLVVLQIIKSQILNKTQIMNKKEKRIHT